MRTLSIRIGSTLLTLLMSMGVCVQRGEAAQSASFRIETDAPNAVTQAPETSTHFSLNAGAVSWYRSVLESSHYQIVPSVAHASDSSLATSASSSSPSSVTNVATPHGGGRGPAPALPGTVAPLRQLPKYPAAPLVPQKSNARMDEETLLRFSLKHKGVKVLPQQMRQSAPRGVRSAYGLLCPYEGRCMERQLSNATCFPLQSTSLAFLLIGGGLALSRYARRLMCKKRRKPIKQQWRWFLLLLFAAGMLSTFAGIVLYVRAMLIPPAHAATTGPVTHIYNGHLLESNGTPVTSAVTIRFSFWKSADYSSTDTTATGSINTGSTNYASWQEVQSVTPNSNGYFSVELGSVTSLPSWMTTTSSLAGYYLQVEVKMASAVNTSFELLDVNSSDATIDRSHLASVPFAQNADLLDQRDLGTASGSIPLLQTGGLLPVSEVPGGTNRDLFVLDFDNTASSTIGLQFGNTLAKTLTYDVVNSRFNFSSSLRVQGDLTVTGLINGVDVTTLQGATGALKAFSGGGLNLRLSGGNYRVNGTITNFTGSASVVLRNNATNYVFFTSTGLTVNTLSFPVDKSIIPVAQVTTTNGSISVVNDRRVLQSDDRQNTIMKVLHPGYEGASYQGDGAENVGQLYVSHDNINLKNFYLWTSSKTSLQDYDVIIRAQIPLDFKKWTGSGIVVYYRSTSVATGNNKLDITVYDTNGVPVSLVGSASNLTSTSWASTTLTFSGAPTWTAGQEFIIRLKMSAKDDYQMQIGDLKLHYQELNTE